MERRRKGGKVACVYVFREFNLGYIALLYSVYLSTLIPVFTSFSFLFFLYSVKAKELNCVFQRIFLKLDCCISSQSLHYKG